MKKPHVFRPQLSEILETRAVPSMAGVALPTGLPGITVTLPPQISPTNPQVQSAFKAFDQSYVQAVDTLLSSPGSDGLVVSANNLATFHTSIEDSIDALAKELVATLNSNTTSTTTTTTTTTTTATTTNSTVASQVVAAISGATHSLESQLLSLSIQQVEAEVPTAVAASSSSNSTSVANVVTATEQVHVPSRVPVAQATGTTSATTSPSSTASPTPAPAKPADDVRSAFNTFLGSYFQAAQATLLANGSSTPQANRAAFNAEVGQAIQTLETSLTTALSRYPATSGLGPQIQSTLGGTGQTGLKSQLAKLATPEGAQAAVVREFTLGSTQAIAQALAAITGEVARLVTPAGN